MSEIVGVVLAGGLGRRMGGGDKALVALGGRHLLDRVIERFAPQVGPLVLNANGDPARFETFGLPVAADPVAGHPGPLAGLLAGMRWAETHRPGARHVATAAADTPFLPLDLVARLAASLDGADPDGIAVPVTATGTHQVCALFPISLADALEEALVGGAARKVMAWIERHPVRHVAFGPLEGGLDPFFNVNTLEDLAAAEDWIAAHDPVQP